MPVVVLLPVTNEAQEVRTGVHEQPKRRIEDKRTELNLAAYRHTHTAEVVVCIL